MIGLIWAQTADGVIGADGAMPWHLPEDLAQFRLRTAGAVVVMGRRTWDSLPERFRPLPGRRNIVLTRHPGWRAPGAETAGDLATALAAAGERDVWVIGGAEVYAQALPSADRLVRTEVDLSVPGDAHAPRLDADRWRQVESDPPEGWHTSRTGVRYRVRVFEPVPVDVT
jgi:dihydrofolate reductase